MYRSGYGTEFGKTNPCSRTSPMLLSGHFAWPFTCETVSRYPLVVCLTNICDWVNQLLCIEEKLHIVAMVVHFNCKQLLLHPPRMRSVIQQEAARGRRQLTTLLQAACTSSELQSSSKHIQTPHCWLSHCILPEPIDFYLRVVRM